MRDLTNDERVFLFSLLKLKPQKHRGYFRFTNGNKHFKRSRIVMQLSLNKKFDIFDLVHHKDGNKSNDNEDNLELTTIEKHSSCHGGKKKKCGAGGKNKIDKEKELDIYRLSKILIHKNGCPNYKAIAKRLDIAGQTVRKYILNRNKMY